VRRVTLKSLCVDTEVCKEVFPNIFRKCRQECIFSILPQKCFLKIYRNWRQSTPPRRLQFLF